MDGIFIPERSIEQDAQQLLQTFEREIGKSIAPPVPIDDIAEGHLGLRMEMRELCREFRAPDVYGALWVDDRRIAIDTSLDPTNHPKMLGRFRFTLAHEVGHWCMHREHIQSCNHAGMPSYICRSSRRRDPIEVQADSFAAAMLMPRHLVQAAWQREFGRLRPMTSQILRHLRYRILREEERKRGGWRLNPREQDDALFEVAVERLAGRFQVSPIAFRIRCENFGLIIRHNSRCAIA